MKSPDADSWALPSQGLLERTDRLLSRLLACYLSTACLVGASYASATPWIVEARVSGLAGLVLSLALIGTAGLAACAMASDARCHVRRPRKIPSGRFGRRMPAVTGHGRLAQAVVVPLVAALGGGAAWSSLHWPPVQADPAFAASLGGLVFALALPALLAERFVAATPAAVLPEARALRHLLRVPVLLLPLLAGLEVLRGQDLVWPGIAVFALALALTALAAELALRGLARWFQPATDPAQARAAIGTLLADLPGWFAGPHGGGSPLRDHFGLDFSRSWALGYLRRAAAPAIVLTALVCWGLSGVVILPVDSRGVYERFGDPVAVLAPGLHLTLPWPLAQVRPVELGVVHDLALGTSAAALTQVSAEAPAPPSADRLWDQPHPGETNWLIAGDGANGQSFQVMSAEILVKYRIGLADADAIHALYGSAQPDALVREIAGQAISSFFAGSTLASLLDQRHEAMAATLQTEVAAALDQPRSGLELVSVTIEAVHPPVGAAASYHNVQAAEIIANTGIASETGRAKSTASMARSQSWDILDKSKAVAAETVSAADADGRQFGGDRAARDAGGRAFLLERYFQDVSAALAKAPLTIMDHRMPPGMAPVVDLRPYAAAAKAIDDGD